MNNTLTIKIKGKNINRFLKRLNRLEINIYNINYIKNNEIIIIVNKEDYEKIELNKTTYEIEIIDFNGIDKIKYIIKINKYLIISCIVSLMILYLLCNTIFSVDVIHNDSEIRKIIKEELQSKGIDKYKFKKSYKEKEQIKKHILYKYKDKLEWIEIEEHGTKYIVRVEERVIQKDKEENGIKNIVAKKDAIILKIENISGETIKNKNDYVKKDDVIISSNITLYDEVKKTIPTKGTVYGEVWYKVIVEYPLYYNEKIYTGNTKNVLTINFFNKNFDFTFHPFKNKISKNKTIIKNKIFPISFEYQEQREIKLIEEKLTYNEALKKAINKGKEKINSKLSDKEYIISTKKLKVEKNNSKIIVELFVSVCEDITEYKEIEEQGEINV